jgi:hypothetical protein
MPITHTFVSGKADGGDSTLVRPSNWNADHSGMATVYKSADETVNNSATLQDDDHLILPVLANETWSFKMTLLNDSAPTADIKVKFTVPSGTTMKWMKGEPNPDSSVLNTEGTTYMIPTGGSEIIDTLIGIITVGGTAGNVTLQWAQNAAEVSDTKILKGSSIVAWRLN